MDAAALITRIQLSLYVPQPASAELEAVRCLLDPVQARLIPAHVTLCREDELADVEPAVLRSRLAEAQAGPITLSFGPPEPFAGHGILLRCVAGEAGFQSLRRWLLGTGMVRSPAPHITLAHPRNPKAKANCISTGMLPVESTFTFASVHRIQQTGTAPWQVLEQFALAGGGSNAQTRA